MLGYVEKRTSEGAVVLIPAFVVSEFLVGVDQARHDAVMETLNAFSIPAFDVKAARITAEFRRRKDAFASSDQGSKGAGGGRQQVVLDFAVLASAVAAGADEILTNDDRFDKIAGDRIRVVKVADLPSVQGELHLSSPDPAD